MLKKRVSFSKTSVESMGFTYPVWFKYSIEFKQVLEKAMDHANTLCLQQRGAYRDLVYCFKAIAVDIPTTVSQDIIPFFHTPGKIAEVKRKLEAQSKTYTETDSQKVIVDEFIGYCAQMQAAQKSWEESLKKGPLPPLT